MIGARFLPVIVAVLGLVAPSPGGLKDASAGSLDMRRTQPVHRSAPDLRLPWPEATVPQRPRHSPRDRLVYRLPEDYRDMLAPSDELTRFCRTGGFRQRLDRHYRAQAPDGRSFGVGFGNGLNLDDPAHRRDPALVYLFRDQDTARCRVWTVPLAAIRPFLVRR